jgi:hypothetical protein
VKRHFGTNRSEGAWDVALPPSGFSVQTLALLWIRLEPEDVQISLELAPALGDPVASADVEEA